MGYIVRYCPRKPKRETETERQRETETHRDRETERDRDTERHIKIDKNKETNRIQSLIQCYSCPKPTSLRPTQNFNPGLKSRK